MKVKLLRKLRKRFSWFRTKQNCWSYIDLKTGKNNYAYTCGFYYVNDMLLYEMLTILKLDYIYLKKKNYENRNSQHFSGKSKN